MADDAMDEEEAMAEDAMEEAMADDAMAAYDDDSDQAGESAEADTDMTARYSLGEFDDRDQLKAAIEVDGLDISIDELLEGVTEFESGFIPSCRDEIPELTDSEPGQVLTEAFLENEGFIVAEVYVLTNTDSTRDLYVVDSDDCSLIAVVLGQ